MNNWIKKDYIVQFVIDQVKYKLSQYYNKEVMMPQR